jgi:hypothetical protein
MVNQYKYREDSKYVVLSKTLSLSPTEPTWTYLISNLKLHSFTLETKCLSHEKIMTFTHTYKNRTYRNFGLCISNSIIYRLYLLLQIFKHCTVAVGILIFPNTCFTLRTQLCLSVRKHCAATHCHCFPHHSATKRLYRNCLAGA